MDKQAAKVATGAIAIMLGLSMLVFAFLALIMLAIKHYGEAAGIFCFVFACMVGGWVMVYVLEARSNRP